VFSLQRIIDDIGRKRQERRFASQSQNRLTEVIEHVFGADIDKLKEIFPSSGIVTILDDFPAYIEIRPLRDIGVNAFLVSQTIEVAQMPRYVMTIRNGREKTEWQHYNNDHLHTFLKHDQELAGFNMRLLTNDIALIRQLADARFNPPCQWIAFYELGPIAGSLQGNAEYWYHHVWDRYWEALSLHEQSEFLARKRQETISYMSESEWRDWISGLRFRDPRTRDSP